MSAEVEMELAGLDKSKFIEIHNPMATKAEFRVRIPVKEFPQVRIAKHLLKIYIKTVKV